jgi:O-antigen/teichoic acid export membrane protein
MVAKLGQLPPRIIMLGSFTGMSIINYLFGLAIGWLLLPGDYGLVAFAQTIILVAGLMLNSGFAWSLTAQVAKADGAEQSALIRGALLADLLLALSLSGAIIGLFALGALRSGLETWDITLIVAASLPFLAITAIANGAVRGAEQFGTLASLRLLEVVGKAIGGIVLVKIGLGATGAVLGFFVGAVLAGIFGLWRVARIFDMRFVGRVGYPSLRLAGGMFGALLGMALLLNLDILFLKLFSGAERETTGYYQAAIMLANTPYYLGTAMFTVMFPRLARLDDISQSGEVVGDTLRLVLLFLIPIEIGIFIAPYQILDLVFPADYLSAAPMLRILAVGNGAIILVAMLSTSFQALDKARIPAVVLLSVTALEAFVLRMVAPAYSATGTASTFVAACLAAFVFLGIIYSRFIPTLMTAKTVSWLARYGLSLMVALGVFFILYEIWQALFLLSAIIATVCYLFAASGLGLLPVPMVVIYQIKKNRKVV